MTKNIDAVYVEAGHGKKTFFGGFDMGASSKGFDGNTIYERDLNKELGSMIVCLLQSKLSIPVKPMAISTNGATLEEKQKYINDDIAAHGFKNALSISLHFNSIDGNSASGTEIFYPTMKSSALALAISASFQQYKIFPMRNPAIKASKDYSAKQLYMDFWNCNDSVLIESCFISNPNDLHALFENKNRLAECISHAILQFVNS